MAYLADKEEDVQLIGFYAAQKLYGADILSVREILRDPEVEPIEAAPGFVKGMVRLRGESIPIVNLKERLNIEAEQDAGDLVWVLIAKTEDRAIGYMVDAVTRILKIDLDAILPAPDLVLAGLRSQYIRGVCKSDLGLLVVLDLDRMLAEDEIKAIKKL